VNNTTRLFASLIFTAIAAFLVIYSWVPARHHLQREEGRVSHIIPQPNTWFEAEIITSSGIRLTCRARRGWPLVGPDRCPVEKLERSLGLPITVTHDGKRPYEVSIGRQIVIDYAAHRQIQMLAIILAGLLLLMAAWVWRR
jgi:hypothetical protein